MKISEKLFHQTFFQKFEVSGKNSGGSRNNRDHLR